MKQINGGNWVEKLQISSKQFWESGDREWQGSVIIAESLFTGSEKTIALCVSRQLKKETRQIALPSADEGRNTRLMFTHMIRWVFFRADNVSVDRYMHTHESINMNCLSSLAN